MHALDGLAAQYDWYHSVMTLLSAGSVPVMMDAQ